MSANYRSDCNSPVVKGKADLEVQSGCPGRVVQANRGFTLGHVSVYAVYGSRCICSDFYYTIGFLLELFTAE